MRDDRPTFGSLFAGIGGIDLGLERAGWRGRWQVEYEPFCQRVLAKHWPDVQRYGDIHDVDWSGVERVDLVAGGFPCQPVSGAGRRQAQADERWLWPEFLRCIRALRPNYVLVGPGYPADYLALPIGPGKRVLLCGPARCLVLVSTDAGPNRASLRAGRIADVSVELFRRLCCPESRGLFRGSWRLTIPLPDTSTLPVEGETP